MTYKEIIELTGLSFIGAFATEAFYPKETLRQALISGTASMLVAIAVGYILTESGVPSNIVHGACGIAGATAYNIVQVIKERVPKWLNSIKLPKIKF